MNVDVSKLHAQRFCGVVLLLLIGRAETFVAPTTTVKLDGGASKVTQGLASSGSQGMKAQQTPLVPALAVSSAADGFPTRWQPSVEDFQKMYDTYATMMKQHGDMMTDLTPLEKQLLPPSVVHERASAIARARDVNSLLFEDIMKSFIAEIDSESGIGDGERGQARQLLKVVQHPGSENAPQYYATMNSIFMHLLRDWSGVCSHVADDVYRPMVQAVKDNVPSMRNGERTKVLIPGSGLSRLPFEMMMAGYDVECNEVSSIFVSVANYLYNHCDTAMASLPLAHMFTENRRLSDQYFETAVPCPVPRQVVPRGPQEMDLCPVKMTTGDFVSLYMEGGQAHCKVGAVVTCFFIDTCEDLLKYILTIDSVLEVGGVWVNFGPLNFQNNVRLKLSWMEIQKIWEGLGYTFISSEQVHTAYTLLPGVKLHTEQYDAQFTVAVKGDPAQAPVVTQFQ